MPGFLDDYEPVEDRLAKFWADHPEGQIVTEVLPAPEGQWVVRASVWRTGLHILAGDLLTNEATSDIRAVMNIPDATGHAQETIGSSNVNTTSALENCETSAIGRALANLGYAAKGKRASREEMSKTVDTPPEDGSAWLASEVEKFGLWTPEQQKAAGVAAAKSLKPGKPINRLEAEALLAHMQGAYYQEFPDTMPFEIGDK